MRGVRIFDNLGRTRDRYTLVICNAETEDVYIINDDNSNMFCYSAIKGSTRPHNNEVELLGGIPENLLQAVIERLD